MTNKEFVDFIKKLLRLEKESLNQQIVILRYLPTEEKKIFNSLKKIELNNNEFKFQRLLQRDVDKNLFYTIINQKSKITTLDKIKFNYKEFLKLLSQLKGTKTHETFHRFCSLINSEPVLIKWAELVFKRGKIFSLPTTLLEKEIEYNSILANRKGHNYGLNWERFGEFFGGVKWGEVYYCILKSHSQYFIEFINENLGIVSITRNQPIIQKSKQKIFDSNTPFEYPFYLHVYGGTILDINSRNTRSLTYFNRLERGKQGLNYQAPAFSNDLKNMVMLEKLNKENIIYLCKRDKPWKYSPDKEIILYSGFLSQS